MRTYLMAIPEILKGISHELDITATLCDKSWVIFNDEGVKTIFIFNRDGTLIVSKNGLASKQHWSYIKATDAILIDKDEQSFLLHPAFIDNVIFALNQDGTNHYLFMIDEKQIQQHFSRLTLKELNGYFEAKSEKERLELKRSEADEQEAVNKKLAKEEINQQTAPLNRQQNKLIFIFSFTVLAILSGLGVLSTLIKNVNITITLWCILLPICVLGYIFLNRKLDKLDKQIFHIKNEIWRKYEV